MNLLEPRDPKVRGIAPNLETGKKWSPAADTLSAMSNKANEASA